jgi:phytoene synthase
MPARPDPVLNHDRTTLIESAHASIVRGSHSFAAASRLFGRETRERAWLLYCWCRAADDLTDGQEAGHAGARAGDPVATHARLATLTALALDSDSPVPLPFMALRQVARETALPRRWIFDHLEGFAMDAAGWRPNETSDLLRYCYHVAGVVGLMMAIIMGVDPADEDTLDRACDLGIAFQLANIARDIVPDAETGRVYLPAQWLEEAGKTPAEPALPENRQQLGLWAKRLVDMAQDYRASARVGAARLPRRSRLAVLAAEAIYGAIGERVVQRGAAAWDQRVHIGSAGKLRLLAVAAARSGSTPEAAPRTGLWTRPRRVHATGPI